MTLTNTHRAILNSMKSTYFHSTIDDVVEDTGLSKDEVISNIKELNKTHVTQCRLNSSSAFISATTMGWKLMGWKLPGEK